MNSLHSRKQLLVAEATVQRQLLGADVERLAQQASGWKQRFFSVRTVASAGFSAVSFFGMFRGRRAGRESTLAKLFRWGRAGWTLWNTVQPVVAQARAKAQTAPRPTAPKDEVAEAMEALRQAEHAARQRR